MTLLINKLDLFFQPPADTSSLYSELSKLQQTQDFEKGVKVCNKILSLAPTDTTAFHCKIVCMVQTGKFQEALKQIEDTHFKLDLVLIFPLFSFILSISLDKRQLFRQAFEEAYSYYRLNETEKALEAINKVRLILKLKKKPIYIYTNRISITFSRLKTPRSSTKS